MEEAGWPVPRRMVTQSEASHEGAINLDGLSPMWICLHASGHHTLGRRWNGRNPEGQRPSNQQYYNSPHSPRDNKHRYRHGEPGCGYGEPLVSRYLGMAPLAVGLRSMLGKRSSRTWDREVCRRYGYMRALPRYMQGFAE